jgi:hypothetical protein
MLKTFGCPKLENIFSSLFWNPYLGSDAFFTPGSGTGQKSRSGSGMNIQDHISESSDTILWVKNTEMGPRSGMFLTLNQESGMEKFGSGIRDKHPGSATLPMPMPLCPSVWTGILMLTFCVTNIVRFLLETLKPRSLSAFYLNVELDPGSIPWGSIQIWL